MGPRFFLAIALLGAAAPASAEKLDFDFRLYPALQKVVDAGDKDMIDFDQTNPARLVDVIAIKGTSAHEWTEAVEIVAMKKSGRLQRLSDWAASINRRSTDLCPGSRQTVIAEEANSVTFEQRAPGCTDRAAFGIYRLVAGKRSWFQLALVSKADLAPPARDQWLALLASAHLAN